MQINLCRKLSDTSIISHSSKNREEIDKYNNRPPLRKSASQPEEILISLEGRGTTMDLLNLDWKNLKRSPLVKDCKTSNFFTGFHHKAFLENVQNAQSKSKGTSRSRSTSPVLPPIPYLTKKQQSQNITLSPKISSIRPKFVKKFPQKHSKLTNRTRVSRSTSPISFPTAGGKPSNKDFPKEVPQKGFRSGGARNSARTENAMANDPEGHPKLGSSRSGEEPAVKDRPKEASKQAFHLEQAEPLLMSSGDSSESMQNAPKEETVTPSKILRHFQFRHGATKDISRDIPEKLLNRSQRFDQAFREIVQSGNKNIHHEPQEVPSQSRVWNCRSKYDGAFKENYDENSEETPNEILNPSHGSRYGKTFQENIHDRGSLEESSARFQNCSRDAYQKLDPGATPRSFANSCQKCRSARTFHNIIHGKKGDPKQVSICFQNRGHGSELDIAFHKDFKQSSSMSCGFGQRGTCGEVFQENVWSENGSPREVAKPFQNEDHGREFKDSFQKEKISEPFFSPKLDPGIERIGKIAEKINLSRKLSQGKNGISEENFRQLPNCIPNSSAGNCQFGNGDETQKSPGTVSELLYRNYGQYLFEHHEVVASKVSQESFESRTSRKSNPVAKDTQTIAVIRNQLENLSLCRKYNRGMNHKKSFESNPEESLKTSPIQTETKINFDQNKPAQANFCLGKPEDELENLNVQPETLKCHQPNSDDNLNTSNTVLGVHEKVSLESVSSNGSKRSSSVPTLKKTQKRYQNPREIELISLNFEEGKPKTNQGVKSLIGGIREKVFQNPKTAVSAKVPEGSVWDEPKRNRDNPRFPRETRNAVMMMLNGPKKFSRKNEENHQGGVRQAQTQTSEKTSCTKVNVLKNCKQLPCPKNLLCEKGLHSGKCGKSGRKGEMMQGSKHCACKRRFWCAECQNIWPGSAKRCEEMSPEHAFLQIMEPKWGQNSREAAKSPKKNFGAQVGVITPTHPLHTSSSHKT